MVRLAAFTQRIHMRVLAKKQEIRRQLLVIHIQAPVLCLNRQRLGKNFLLVIPRLLVIDQAEITERYFFINQGIHFNIQKNFWGQGVTNL